MAAEARVRANIPPGVIDRAFYYSTAIEYPFKTCSFICLRYGDGAYGVWYGSLEQETTIFETAFHALMGLLGDIHDLSGIVRQERAVYLVRCKALLIDLRGKKESHPALTGDDYSFCQQIGRRLHHEGHPGLLAPSARCDGNNMVIFEPKVLNRPRISHYLSYDLIPAQRRCLVKRGRKTLMNIGF
ncbi:MAG: RES family NAD+ phosphorylase [Desulfuromonadaceae bacterium]|nr:RES family NAD+ phosphorylase [Desulfuromonadaceae bacterium]